MIQRRMKRKQGCLEKVIKDIATKEVGWVGDLALGFIEIITSKGI